jgi:hypothetical protein
MMADAFRQPAIIKKAYWATCRTRSKHELQ